MGRRKRTPPPQIQCIYCGQQAKSSEEHVVQDSLGGKDVLLDVCEPCNNGMTDIDRNLSVNSPLSLLAIQELDETGPRSWTHDPDDPGVLLESRGGIGTDAQKLYPQVVFRDDDFTFHCDQDEIDRLGAEQLQQRFYARLREAYEGFDPTNKNPKRKDHKKKAMLTFRRVERLLPGEKLPPRIFCRTQVSEFEDELNFELKYHEPGDDDRILAKLSTFDWNYRAPKSRQQLGSDTATVNFTFSLTDVMRAVAKIGFNLLSFHCKATEPSITTFQRTVEWIRFSQHVAEFGDDSKFGFIYPEDIAALGCPPKSHMFRLTHDPTTNTWKMYASFFGNRAAVYVAFHGPNKETWATMDVVMPYEKPMLPPVFHNWYLPFSVRITKNPMTMIPSVPWTRGHSLETRIGTDQ